MHLIRLLYFTFGKFLSKLTVCDNVVVIDEGKIVEEGKTEDIFANPQSDVARKLLEKRL